MDGRTRPLPLRDWHLRKDGSRVYIAVTTSSVKIEGRVHCFWTGKPLRAFAQTQPKREERDEGEPVEW